MHLQVCIFKATHLFAVLQHRWELLGNYRDFIRLMVFYNFCWEIVELLLLLLFVTYYIYIQSLMLFKWENNWVIFF